MQNVSHAEVLAAAGVSPLTLRKWVVRGLLPEPQRVGSGRAKGSRNHWPTWAPARARWVREQRDLGVTIDELVELVKLGSAPGDP